MIVSARNGNPILKGKRAGHVTPPPHLAIGLACMVCFELNEGTDLHAHVRVNIRKENALFFCRDVFVHVANTKS